jgi:starvation-inducible outer membrane lipoprotein
VRTFGGTGTLEIPADKKFVNVTWKGNELWIITRNRTLIDTTYETYQFQEKSSWGMVEGTYIIKETK